VVDLCTFTFQAFLADDGYIKSLLDSKTWIKICMFRCEGLGLGFIFFYWILGPAPFDIKRFGDGSGTTILDFMTTDDA
jgi:hypothetical protein